MIGNVGPAELQEGDAVGVIEPLSAGGFGIATAKTSGNGNQHSRGMRAVQLDRLGCRRHGASVGNHARVDLESNAIMPAAVHLLVGMPLKDDCVAGSRSGTGQDALAKAETKADVARSVAGEPHRKQLVRMRGENFPSEKCAPATEADAGNGGVEIERAAIFGDCTGVVKGKLQLRKWQIGAEVLHVPGQILAAELLELVILAVEEELTHLMQVWQGAGIDLVGSRCAGPRGGFGERDALYRRTAIDHPAEKAVADGERFQPSRGRLLVPEFVACIQSLRQQSRRNRGQRRKSDAARDAALEKYASAGFVGHRSLSRSISVGLSWDEADSAASSGCEMQGERLRALHLLTADFDVLRLGRCIVTIR